MHPTVKTRQLSRLVLRFALAASAAGPLPLIRANAQTAPVSQTTVLEDLVARKFEPRLGDWLLGPAITADEARQLVGTRALPTEQVRRFIELAEIAYPGLVFVFMGRDTAPLAQAVDAYLTAHGEAGRVITLPLSGPSIASMDDGEIIEFLTQAGVNPKPGTAGRPYILMDRTEYNRGATLSQIAKLTSAFYKAFERVGFRPEEYLSKLNLISVRKTLPNVQSPLNYVFSRESIDTFKQWSGARLFRGQREGKTELLLPERAMWMQVPDELIDQETTAWHGSFGKVRRGDLLLEKPLAAKPGSANLGALRILSLAQSRSFWNAFAVSAMHEGPESFLNAVVRSSMSSQVEIDWDKLVDLVADREISAGLRFRYLNWFLNLKRTSGAGSDVTDRLLVALGADRVRVEKMRTGYLERIRDKSSATVSNAEELMLLGQFLRTTEKAAMSEAETSPVLERLSETIDRWAAGETLRGRIIGEDRGQMLEDFLGLRGTDVPLWSRRLLRRNDFALKQVVALQERDLGANSAANESVVNYGKENVPGVSTRAKIARKQLFQLVGTGGLMVGVPYWLAHPTMLDVPLAPTLFALGTTGFVLREVWRLGRVMKNVPSSSALLDHLTGTETAPLLTDSTRKIEPGERALRALETNRQTGVRACLRAIDSGK